MQTQQRLLRPEDFKRTSWKNGLGWTDQIAISPESADLRRGDFDWRVSTAKVAQSANFSPFPDHDRVLVVLEGAGVKLLHTFEESEAPETVEVPQGEPYEFPGDVPTRCELQDGPIQDFSVFIRRGRVSAMVETARIEEGQPFEWLPEGGTSFIFVIQGQVDASGSAIHAGEALRLDHAAGQSPLPLTLTSEHAEILLVQLG